MKSFTGEKILQGRRPFIPYYKLQLLVSFYYARSVPFYTLFQLPIGILNLFRKIDSNEYEIVENL